MSAMSRRPANQRLGFHLVTAVSYCRFQLDRAVDAAYGIKFFASEAERVAFLFERYQALTSLLPEAKTKKRTRQV
jgi:hypothetical protein